MQASFHVLLAIPSVNGLFTHFTESTESISLVLYFRIKSKRKHMFCYYSSS